jgi:hypothetical protein
MSKVRISERKSKLISDFVGLLGAEEAKDGGGGMDSQRLAIEEVCGASLKNCVRIVWMIHK